MIWLVPGAFAALLLLGGPIAVHMLARRNARRLTFPATHFVRATQAAAVTLRRPSDLGLLLLRLAIVAVAVLAAAGPLLMTPWRMAQWNARVSRAVVVDTSRSMSATDVPGRLADQEATNAFGALRLDTPVLPDGIERAADWLQSAPPSRREIVVISDFQRGSLDEEALKRIPADVGVRLVRASSPPATRHADAAAVEGWRDGIWQVTAAIEANGTRATWSRRGDAVAPSWVTVAASPAEVTAADRALRAAAARGVPAGDPARRLLVRFAGAGALLPAPQPVQSPWIAVAALALARSDLVQDVEPGVTVLERDGVMVVDAPIPAADFAAAAVIRAALLAVRPAAILDREAEVVTLSDADLARWRRDPAPVTTSANPRGDEGDARWLWAVALVLLLVEARVRGSRPRGSRPRAARDGGQAAEGEARVDAA